LSGGATLNEALAAEAEFDRQLLDDFFDQVDEGISAMAAGVPHLAEWGRTMESSDSERGGKTREPLMLTYSRRGPDTGAQRGDCRVKVVASAPGQGITTLDTSYRARVIVDVGSRFVLARVFTENPELPRLENEILEVVRAAAAAAAEAERFRLQRVPLAP